MSTLSYRDAHASLEERVEHLLSLMTLDEKLAQLGCLWSTSFVRDGIFSPAEVVRLIPHGIGQITRIGAATGLRPRENAALMNAIQKVVLERTRLGIPVMVHEEAIGGFCQRDATVFPQALGLAASWNPELITAISTVMREQMLAVGARHALAPVLDVARDPRWGRVEETYGEDPVLVGTLGQAYVRGLQGADLRQGIAATGKHFLGYAMSYGGRNWGPVHLGPRELREVYAEPFAAVMRSTGLATVMNSYTSVDGIPCAGNPELLTGLLREELGFNGVVVADYDSVAQLMRYHRTAQTPGEAGRQALQAGIDMELPVLECYGEALKAEIEAGRLACEFVDTAVRRVLRLKFQLGLFEQPYVDEHAAPLVFQTSQQRELARRAVVESTILLTNDGVLPLAPALKRLAIIGPGADDARLLQGDYHYPAHQEILYQDAQSLAVAGLDTPQAVGDYAPGPYFTPHVTPLEGLRAALPACEISFAQGCEVFGNDTSGFAEAVQLARESDIVIAVVAGKSGLRRPVSVGEGNDATDLDLTGRQSELITLLASTGKPLVVVVLSGRVHTLERIAEQANALLQLFPAGEEGGNGLADILAGKANPGGRLPVTLPRSVGQVPIFVGQRAGAESIPLFGDYIDSPATPLFAFGHGLSYTTFAYSHLCLHAATIADPIEIACDVENTGAVAGDEVVQLYCCDEVASVARPTRQLIGFARVRLEPGQARRLTFQVHPSRLAFYNPAMRFVTEPGSFTFSLGASSVDIRLEETVLLDGPVIEYRQREIVDTIVTIS